MYQIMILGSSGLIPLLFPEAAGFETKVDAAALNKNNCAFVWGHISHMGDWFVVQKKNIARAIL